MGSMCGQQLLSLGQLAVRAAGDGHAQAPGQRLFSSPSGVAATAADATAANNGGRASSRQQQLWVLGRSQPFRELLAFFARTPHSAVPVVEDEGSSGGVLGLLSRRDLLDFLDLATQTSRRNGAGVEVADSVSISAAMPVGAVLE